MLQSGKKGTILIVVVLAVLVLSTIMYSSLRNVSYTISLVKEREKSEQQYYTLYALCRYVLVHYKDIIAQNNGNKELLFNGQWPDQESGYTALAWVEGDGKEKTITVQLQHGAALVASISYRVHPELVEG